MERDLLNTRPPGRKPMNKKNAEFHDPKRKLEDIQAMHASWAMARVGTKDAIMNDVNIPDKDVVVHNTRRRGRTPSPPRIESPRTSKRPNVAASPRLLNPLTSEQESSNTTPRGKPFQKGTTITSNQNPKVFHSFLVNFLEDDLCTLKHVVDLTKHEKDSGVRVTDSTLQELADIHPEVRGILAPGCDEISDVGLWALARNCTKIVEINFARCSKISHIGLRSLSLRCTDLRVVNLNFCDNINDLALRVLGAGCPQIVELQIAGCSAITDAGVSDVAKCCKELEILNMNKCVKLSEYGDRAMIDLGNNCANLRELYLGSCEFTSDSGIRAVARGCAFLKIVDLSGCTALTGAAIRAVARGCPHIDALNLSDCKNLTNADVCELSAALTQLQSLDLRNLLKLKKAGVQGMCAHLKNLEVLNLAGCTGVDNECLTVMGNSLRRLSKLNLCNVKKIGDMGVRNLCHGCTHLVNLELMGCKKVTRDFLEKLVKELPFVLCAPDRLALIPRPNAQQLIEETERMRVQNAAAVVIQKLVRGIQARGGVRKLRDSALRRYVVPKVQSLCRGHLTRKHLREAREDRERRASTRTIQRVYRGYKGRQRHRKIRRIQKIRSDHEAAAIWIQSVYRGHVSRCITAKARQENALEALRIARQEALEIEMALRIQRNVRMYQGLKIYRAMVYTGRKMELDDRKKEASSIRMQTWWRRKIAQWFVETLRQKQARERLELASSVLIQRVFRGFVARKLVLAIKTTRMWQMRVDGALALQRVWRGCKGRHVASLMRNFAAMVDREHDAAVKVQNFWRNKQASRLMIFLKQLQVKHKQDTAAAQEIQRIFRGHKGREAFEIKKRLKLIEGQLKPLQAKLATLTAKRDAIQKQVDSDNELVAGLQKQIDGLNRELDEVSKHKSKWFDSASITGSLQRFQTHYLAQALRTRLEDVHAEFTRIHQNTLDPNISELRTLDKDIRVVMKEVAPLESNVTMNVKRNRSRALYNSVRSKKAACVRIQKAFRTYRYKLAVTLGGYQWQESMDGVTGVVKYHNIYTQEYTYERPWAYRVVVENKARTRSLFGLVDTSKRNRPPWTEHYDADTNNVFYYNAGTNEYRWEKPQELLDYEKILHQDTSWLQVGAEKLTARSSRMRSVASGWVEYIDSETQQKYYFNTKTQTAQLEKPEGFDSTWLASQDTAMLTKRSMEVRKASQWVEYDNNGTRYYYNSHTGETQWEKPEGFDSKWLKEHEQVVTARSMKNRKIAFDWEELIDPDSGCSYYYNTQTGETRWSLSPRALTKDNMTPSDASAQHESHADIHHDYENASYSIGDVTEQDSAASWLAQQNILTLMARSVPVGYVNASWEEFVDTESGRSFYWNKEANQATWSIDLIEAGKGVGVQSDSFAVHIPENFDDELKQKLKDPFFYDNAKKILQYLHDRLEYDHVLSGIVEQLAGAETDALLRTPEYVESIQWIAEYILKGELLSATSVASHALALVHR